MRWLYLLAVSFLLSACAMPAAFTVASLTLDTGSFMMSGKTLTDHGLSLAMDQDCSMKRVLDEEDEICQQHPDYEVADANLRPLPPDLDLALAAGGDPHGGVVYAQLVERVHRARTDQSNYLSAGMLESGQLEPGN